jgi:phytoene dehydrogenase-like protein
MVGRIFAGSLRSECMRLEYDAIVVGAGISGLCVAALLAKAKKRVLVLEKAGRVGGRATTLTKMIEGEPWRSDISGFHAMTMGERGALAIVYKECIGIDKLRSCLTPPQGGMVVFRQGKWHSIRELIKRENRDDFKKVIDEIATMKYADVGLLDTVSFKKWIETRTKRRDVCDYFRIIGFIITTLADHDSMSAGECVYTIKMSLDAVHSVSSGFFVKGGSINLSLPLVDYVKASGGDVRTGVRVEKVIIENGGARGVVCSLRDMVTDEVSSSANVIHAPIIVYTGPIFNFIGMAEESKFPSWFVRILQGYRFPSLLTSSGRYIGLDFILDANAISGTEHRVALDMPHSNLTHQGGIPTISDPTLSPPGKIGFGFSGWGGEDMVETLKNYSKTNELYSKLEKDLKLLYPEINETNIIHVTRRKAHPYADGLARSPYFTGNFRIDYESPISNLYFAGDSVRTRGVGIDGAARSAVLCVNRILGLDFPTFLRG